MFKTKEQVATEQAELAKHQAELAEQRIAKQNWLKFEHTKIFVSFLKSKEESYTDSLCAASLRHDAAELNRLAAEIGLIRELRKQVLDQDYIFNAQKD